MDIAYDRIQEENFREGEPHAGASQPGTASPTIQQDLQDAYRAFTASPWGAKLGGFWGSVRKQGEQYYSSAQQDYTVALMSSRGLSLAQSGEGVPTAAHGERECERGSVEEPVGGKEEAAEGSGVSPDRPQSLPADIYKEASMVGLSLAARLKAEAQKRLKEAQRLEDAADEALLKWGTNLGAFLKDAVSVAPPSSEDLEKGRGEVLFASTDGEGKRVVHATRLDAQLHVIHCSLDSFLHDPKSGEWAAWQREFDAQRRTEEIARDLDRHGRLRSAMEKLVPDRVDYTTFWCRYYFLRNVVETEEARRKELLKGAAATTAEDISWEDESEDESTTPKACKAALPVATAAAERAKAPGPKDDSDNATLKPAESRRSNDGQSVSGSDASYDIVSGTTSKASNSPREPKKGEDSDDDWE